MRIAKKILLDRGLTQIQIARKAKVHPVRLCRILNGRFRARRNEKVSIARSLGLPVREVFPVTRRRHA
jgi:transcriptional regulator with XRE-family HTH domain